MMMKQIIKSVLLLTVLFCVVFAKNPCRDRNTGNYCYKDGYVSCPSTTLRPCQSGLVCQQADEGVVYCMRPESTSSATASPTYPPTKKPSPTASATPRPTTVPTNAPTNAPTQKATAAPTVAATSPPLLGATRAPTVAATQAPTVAATQAPTVAATPAPQSATEVPTVKPPTSPTTKPPTSPTTKPPTSPTTKPIGTGSWPNGPVKAICIPLTPSIYPLVALHIDNFCWDQSFSFNTLVDAGYNLIILAFFVNKIPFDCVIAWQSMSQATQLATIAYAHSKGARIIASTGGATDSPYSSTTGAAYGSAVANWVVANNLDGVDFDLENFGRDFTFGSMSTTQTVQWVVDATNAARSIIGTSKIITHAPQPPYFGNYGWADGYGKIYDLAPHIDFFLVQFYNNGPTTSYETIFLGQGYSMGASVMEINRGGVPLNKIVVGKPAQTDAITDLAQGYNTPAQLKSMFTRAKAELGWDAGVMGWQWTEHEFNKNWINGMY